MARTALASALFALFAAASTPPPRRPRPLLDEALIRRSFDAWNAGDFEGWAAPAHPDAEYGPGIVIGRTEGERVVYRGREELRRFFDEWHSVWQTELTIGEIEEVAGWVLITGRMRMTGTQSGATVEQEVGWTAQLEDGRIRRIWSYPSHEEAREALSKGGLTP
jgi:ketosteroid isomerase-like protein